YLPDHIPVALDWNGIYWVIDQNRPSGSGEYSIAVVEFGYQTVARFKTFREFLEAVAKSVSSQLPASRRSNARADKVAPRRKVGVTAKEGVSKTAKAPRKK